MASNQAQPTITLCPITVTPDGVDDTEHCDDGGGEGQQTSSLLQPWSKENASIPNDSIVHMIDLPGDPVRITTGDDHTVLLRKHRDIVIDLALGDGAQYLVHAPNDHFYHEKAKKRTKSARFNDGERFHARVGRDFKGPLIVRSKSGRLELDPNQLDPFDYGDEPKAKPDPIIIKAGAQQRSEQATTAENDPALPDTETGHIVEVHPTSVPEPEQVKAFKNSDRHEASLALNDDTKDWLVAQIAGASAYLTDNRDWIRDLWNQRFKITSVMHKNVGLRYYISFTGNARLRNIITGTRYGAANTKVLNIASGTGSIRNMSKAAAQSMGGAASLKTWGGRIVYLTAAIDGYLWWRDYHNDGDKNIPIRQGSCRLINSEDNDAPIFRGT